MNNIYNPSEDEPQKNNDGDSEENRNKRTSNNKKANNKNVKKLLECHAFVCNNQADAIAIAAKLYQALVETIRKFNNNQAASSDNLGEIGGGGKSSCRVSACIHWL